VFRLGPYYLEAYRSRLNANLAFYDGLDGKTDWPLNDQGDHPLTEFLLTEFLLADFLVVDILKPFAEDSYLEIERALLAGQAHTTCGGRPPNDDIVDKFFTLMVSGVDGRVSVTAWTRRLGRPPAASRTWSARTRLRRI
jgi:hypothetical protein